MKTKYRLCIFRSLPVLCLAAALCSCQTAYKPSAAQTAVISKVAASKKMMSTNPTGNWTGILGGAVLAVGAASAMSSREEVMHQHLVSEIRRLLAEEINARGQFRVVPVGQQSDAVIEAKVDLFGWGFQSGFADRRQNSFCNLLVSMKNRQGKTLWTANSIKLRREILNQFPLNKNLPEDLERNPELMRQELSIAVQRASRQIATSLPPGITDGPR